MCFACKTILYSLLLTAGAVFLACPVQAEDWRAYGGDAGGRRYSTAAQVTPANVAELETAWTFHTGELGENLARADKLTFEATPILIGRTLYFTTATAVVFAIDAATGRERWRFDAKINRGVRYSEMASRGVSYWSDLARLKETCGERLFFGTLDARLIALDARTGKPCADFGHDGAIDLSRGVRLQDRSDYQVTSPPAIAGDTVITGSSVGDNRATNLELGVVRAFDARSGALRWQWDPMPRAAQIPRDAANPDFDEVPAQAASWTGAANAWSVLSVSPDQRLVFVPTGSASPDFFGGERLGDNKWANSVVALEVATGHLVWGQQLIHHDLWDYDVASQPVVAELNRRGTRTPVVIQATKNGQLFVFHRDTGEPVYAVTEKPVPQSTVPGEVSWPTQPFSALPPLVSSARVTENDAWGLTFYDRGKCADKIKALVSQGMFTPPSIQGTIERPGYAGGVNWGGVAFDPEHQYAIAVAMDLPMVVALVPRAELRSMRNSGNYDKSEFAGMDNTPYGMRRELLQSNLGIPCNAPPWGLLVAVDLANGKIAWRVPLGTTRGIAPWPFWYIKGAPSIGGPLITKSGLVFVGAAADDYLRAFNVSTGEEIWKGDLPGGGQATPMTYELDGRQYVVIAAGGYAGLGTTKSDSLVAFALPAP
ncbi:MAG: pyrroloquinoline quinone-dependent dehydrogenase [Steroidobacteraceae bacterium]